MLLASCFALIATAQNPFKVEKYTLKNGLTVYLNEDHTLPKVFGGVAVNAGGKYDPADHTGMGHYLEHMMFKGNEHFGTVDFTKEKPLLDRINTLYDSLGMTKDEKQRLDIQKRINDVAIEAAQYSVPNEIDKLLKSIGGEGINAFTSEELIFYHNAFPPNQVEKWLEIYSERFVNPVFRLFQSELEVVYEEKNRGQDNMGNAIIETFQANFFQNHPYRQSVIGTTEHLKNPSINEMYKYANQYYVANNMALVICGDFDTETIKPIIEEKFGRWKSGNVPTFEAQKFKETPFKGREVVTKRLTPINVGVMGFRTIPNGHKDEPALNVMQNLLSNGSQTGALDKLTTDRKLLMAGTFPMQLNDEGAYIIFFVPKIVGQSLGKAEKIVLSEFEKIKKGEFTENQLSVAKNQLLISFYKSLEDVEDRTVLMANLFTQKMDLAEYSQRMESIRNIQKADVIAAANTYFGNNYFLLQSKMGFPKKDKLNKPPFKPVIPKQEQQSEYVKNFKKMHSPAPKPQYVDMEKDANIISGVGEKLYCVKNPLNKIFSFRIQLKKGSSNEAILAQTATYLGLVGSAKNPAKTFKQKMDSLLCTYNVSVGGEEFRIEVEGLEENFAPAMELLGEMLQNPELDQKRIKNLSDEALASDKFFKREIMEIGRSVKEYAVYGKKSTYLNRLSSAEVKKLTPEQLVNAWKNLAKFAPIYHFVGTTEGEEVKKILQNAFGKTFGTTHLDAKNLRTTQNYTQNTIIFLDNKKARQTQLHFYVLGNNYSVAEAPKQEAFNSYFGEDMSSLMFQEIREFRSLAYTASGMYRRPMEMKDKGYFMGYIGCQADKTLESMDIMNELLQKMPEKPERMDEIRSGLIMQVPAARPSFRNMSEMIEAWKDFGYTEDPMKARMPIYPTLQFSDILDFYAKNIKGKPVVVAITGDKSKIDMAKLAKFGKIVEVDMKDVYKK